MSATRPRAVGYDELAALKLLALDGGLYALDLAVSGTPAFRSTVDT